MLTSNSVNKKKTKMGSTIVHSTCPNCGNPEMHDEYYYKTGEQFQLCDRCGYTYSLFIKRNKKGEFVKVNGAYKWEEKFIEKPYASVSILRNGAGQIGCIKNKKEMTRFYDNINLILDRNPDVEIKISRVVDRKQSIETFNNTNRYVGNKKETVQ